MTTLSKVAVVIGVGPGLGSGVARRFAGEGYKVALMSRRPESSAPIKAAIEEAGGTAMEVIGSASDEAQVAEAFSQVRQAWGDPEVLVYNAGPSLKWPPPSLLDIKLEDWQAAMDAGATGVLLAAQQVLPKMVEAGRGTILLTGATASLRGGANFAVLAAPKFAMRALAQSMSREFQPKGIHVAHILIDGQIDSPRLRSMYPGRAPETMLSPDAIAETYWHLHSQHPTAWTHELELRPATEKW